MARVEENVCKRCNQRRSGQCYSIKVTEVLRETETKYEFHGEYRVLGNKSAFLCENCAHKMSFWHIVSPWFLVVFPSLGLCFLGVGLGGDFALAGVCVGVLGFLVGFVWHELRFPLPYEGDPTKEMESNRQERLELCLKKLCRQELKAEYRAKVDHWFAKLDSYQKGHIKTFTGREYSRLHPIHKSEFE